MKDGSACPETKDDIDHQLFLPYPHMDPVYQVDPPNYNGPIFRGRVDPGGVEGPGGLEGPGGVGGPRGIVGPGGVVGPGCIGGPGGVVGPGLGRHPDSAFQPPSQSLLMMKPCEVEFPAPPLKSGFQGLQLNRSAPLAQVDRRDVAEELAGYRSQGEQCRPVGQPVVQDQHAVYRDQRPHHETQGVLGITGTPGTPGSGLREQSRITNLAPPDHRLSVPTCRPSPPPSPLPFLPFVPAPANLTFQPATVDLNLPSDQQYDANR